MINLPFDQPGSPQSADDEPLELCPALLVDQATADNAGEVTEMISEMLADDLPEEMHEDLRGRLSDLARRFPAQVRD